MTKGLKDIQREETCLYVCVYNCCGWYFSLKLFISSREVPYSGQRDLKSLVEFIEQQTTIKEVGVV